MRSLRRLVTAVIVLSPLALAGCKQGVGDRCQVMSDCEDGLICVLPAGGTPQSGGTCQPQGGGQDAGVADLTPGADLASTDLATASD
ncbi:MAG TPA: hypothetical protein VFF06_24145 [Polyangia bacterium]|nr:hypothetical protein [Polyangia bacterium]